MRSRLALIPLLAFLSAPLLAQNPDDQDAPPPAQTSPQARPPAPPPATARITGTVLCNDTHRPARGAMVMAQPLPKDGNQVNINATASMARVGMDGTYVLSHLQPGDYTVVALLPGYLSPFDDLQIDQTIGADNNAMRERLARNGIVSVRNNETGRMDVTLERGATISGRVLYSDGAPATQVLLNVEDINAKPSSAKPRDPNTPDISAGSLVRGLFLHQSQGTDDAGNFHISGIKPGTYRVAVTQPAENLAQGEGDGFGILFGFIGDAKALRIYAGDTLHKNAATKYELRAGDDVNNIEITIPVYAFHHVSGQLTSLDGQPISVAALDLTDSADDTFVLHSKPSRDGSFVFPTVPSGTYKLAVTGAQLGKAPDNLPEGMPIQAGMLQNPHALADTSSTILVKDSDLTDLSIQLHEAAPAQSAAPDSTASAPQ